MYAIKHINFQPNSRLFYAVSSSDCHNSTNKNLHITKVSVHNYGTFVACHSSCQCWFSIWYAY